MHWRTWVFKVSESILMVQLARLRVRTGLKLPDCCVLYAARMNPPAQLATFDTRLAAGAAALDIGVLSG